MTTKTIKPHYPPAQFFDQDLVEIEADDQVSYMTLEQFKYYGRMLELQHLVFERREKKLDLTPEGISESIRLLNEMAELVAVTQRLPNMQFWTRSKTASEQ